MQLNEILTYIKDKLNQHKSLSKICPTIYRYRQDWITVIEKETLFINDKNPRLLDRLWCLLKDVTTIEQFPKCHFCKENLVRFKIDGFGFSDTCSTTCGVRYAGTKNGDSEVAKKANIKRKETVLKKYGVPHISKLEKIKEKKKETAISNYGSLKNAYIETAKKTIQEKYGVDNISQLDECKEKKQETSISKYGTHYPWQSEKGKEEQKLGVQKKYHVDNVSILDSVKEKKISTFLKNYQETNIFKTVKFIQEHSREKNSNWKGGITYSKYCELFFLPEFKDMILDRDSRMCMNPCCNKINSNDIVIHHIDYNKKNCHPINLITICRSCNTFANFNRDWYLNWYKIIIEKRYGNRGI
jgi:hypothetical protein